MGEVLWDVDVCVHSVLVKVYVVVVIMVDLGGNVAGWTERDVSARLSNSKK